MPPLFLPMIGLLSGSAAPAVAVLRAGSRYAERFTSSPNGSQTFDSLHRQKKSSRRELFFADDRTRTNTLLLGADFESAASAISPHRQCAQY